MYDIGCWRAVKFKWGLQLHVKRQYAKNLWPVLEENHLAVRADYEIN